MNWDRVGFSSFSSTEFDVFGPAVGELENVACS